MARKLLFAALLALLLLGLVAAGAWLAWPRLVAALAPYLGPLAFELMSAEERQALALRHGGLDGFSVAVPDPWLGRLALPGTAVEILGQPVRINNAGLRGTADLGPRDPGRFRIVCLGDSFVFGHGVAEAERFCDQLGAFYRDHGILADGRPIETVAVGLSGWTLTQELAYLVPRFSRLDPDLVILLVLPNDITSNDPVGTGGEPRNDFSPQERAWGSGFYASDSHFVFGDRGAHGALLWLDTPAGNRFWDEALGRLARLETLLAQRGGRLLVSMLNPKGSEPEPFAVRFLDKLRAQGIAAPALPVTFLRGPDTMVPGDGHPNALGHRLLRDQYLAALDRLGWVALPATLQSPLAEAGIRLQLGAPLARGEHDRYLAAYLAAHLTPTLDFARLQPAQTRAFLGGLLPHDLTAGRQLAEPPWAAPRAGFLLLRPAAGALQLRVELEIPARPELFPLELRVRAAGAEVARRFADVAAAGRQTLLLVLPPGPAGMPLEVELLADRFFADLEDNRMKSVRLLWAGLEPAP